MRPDFRFGASTSRPLARRNYRRDRNPHTNEGLSGSESLLSHIRIHDYTLIGCIGQRKKLEKLTRPGPCSSDYWLLHRHYTPREPSAPLTEATMAKLATQEGPMTEPHSSAKYRVERVPKVFPTHIGPLNSSLIHLAQDGSACNPSVAKKAAPTCADTSPIEGSSNIKRAEMKVVVDNLSKQGSPEKGNRPNLPTPPCSSALSSRKYKAQRGGATKSQWHAINDCRYQSISSYASGSSDDEESSPVRRSHVQPGPAPACSSRHCSPINRDDSSISTTQSSFESLEQSPQDIRGHQTLRLYSKQEARTVYKGLQKFRERDIEPIHPNRHQYDKYVRKFVHGSWDFRLRFEMRKPFRDRLGQMYPRLYPDIEPTVVKEIVVFFNLRGIERWAWFPRYYGKGQSGLFKEFRDDAWPESPATDYDTSESCSDEQETESCMASSAVSRADRRTALQSKETCSGLSMSAKTHLQGIKDELHKCVFFRHSSDP